MRAVSPSERTQSVVSAGYNVLCWFCMRDPGCSDRRKVLVAMLDCEAMPRLAYGRRAL